MKPLPRRLASWPVIAILVAMGGSCEVFDKEVFLNEIGLGEPPGVLFVGDSVRLIANAQFGVSPNRPVTRYPSDQFPDEYDWTSSNPAVATVDSYGVVRGVTLGKAVISTTFRTATDTASVRVVPVVSALVLAPTSAAVLVNDTASFDATAVDAQLQPIASIPIGSSASSSIVSGVSLPASATTTRFKFTSKGRGEFIITVSVPNARADRVRRATFTLIVNP